MKKENPPSVIAYMNMNDPNEFIATVSQICVTDLEGGFAQC